MEEKSLCRRYKVEAYVRVQFYFDDLIVRTVFYIILLNRSGFPDEKYCKRISRVNRYCVFHVDAVFTMGRWWGMEL